MSNQAYDVLIIGAGPAGTSAAMALRGSALSVALVDGESFPRDKICGDALSVDVINQLKKLSPSLAQSFEKSTIATQSAGVRIVAPNNHAIDIPFHRDGGGRHGYVCRRTDFDMLMLAEARRGSNITVLESCAVNDLRMTSDVVTAKTSHGKIDAKIVIGADGAHSIVKRKLASSKINHRYHSAGLRMYHQLVGGFTAENFIELYFLRDILPGYLWIFPLPDGYANVGIGMLTSTLSAKKINLIRTFQQLLSTHPLMKNRFRNAVGLEPPRGHGLPLGGATRVISGNRFLLTGDAAALIDPFSGEGIGNAIRSGRFAAEQVLQSFSKNNFGARELRHYDDTMNKMLANEFRVSYNMLRLSKYPWLFNTIVDKANRNKQLHQTLVDALAFPDKKRWLISPGFYFNLLFRS
jgi:geranylgeranyl reductase family protein